MMLILWIANLDFKTIFIAAAMGVIDTTCCDCEWTTKDEVHHSILTT